jgi:catechol 2,3-dioxygenase-like lactoylglutathione lyase family enzyme
MFDHVTIRVSQRDLSQRFYDSVLETLGREKTSPDKWGNFSLAPATAEKSVTRRLHVAFTAPSRDHVDAFWRAGTEAGYQDDGEPGPRPEYSEDYYGAFLLDPDGNSAEAVHHGEVHKRSGIDHLWIRVRDADAAIRFYDLIAPFTGFLRQDSRPDFGHFRGSGASFSVLSGTPTENLHMAFPASTNEVVDGFHRAATEAGYRDNGPPGERTTYHPGYYGAFILDEDGNNIEVVNHNR